MLKRGNIIWKNDSDEAGYIEYINISLDRLGQETIKARGRLMPGVLRTAHCVGHRAAYRRRRSGYTLSCS